MFKKFKLPKNIKLIVSDFDGVFTDGSIYISETMETTKKINFKDIMGVSQAIKNGFDIVLISGEKSKAIDFLTNKFDRVEAHQGIRDKAKVLKEVIKERELSAQEVIYIGDDVNDIDCLNYVGTPITVPNANLKVQKLKNIKITKSPGGDGAFREVVDALLQR